MRLAALIALGALGSCRAAPAGPRDAVPDAPDAVAEVRATLDELYAAFCFDAGAEPDWETLRRIFLDGAAFVPPLGADGAGPEPAAAGAESFLADFRSYALAEPHRSTGFHERIVGARVDAFGGVAHAFVAFEGFVPGDGRAVTRGLDSIQLVHDGARWRLVSFATRYEDDGLVLPERFLRAR